MKNSLKALGIMNGTSLDGVDYALIQVDSDFKKIKFLKHWQKKFPTQLKQQLLLAAQDKLTTYALSELHYDLGRLYKNHVSQIQKDKKFDLIGLHGQTVYHRGGQATAQIGHPGFLSQTTGKPVYFDFRSADIIDGGQGAPFAPFFQKVIAKQEGVRSCAFHNLGGISNLTFLSHKESFAFDTGPANILLDAWMQKNKKGTYDKNGQFSQKGLPHPLIVNQFLKYPFFTKKIPKSTGREEFHLKMVEKWGGSRFKKLSFYDQMATLTDVTALSIARAYDEIKKPPQQIYFYGGGVFNSYLMHRIQFYMPSAKILTTDEIGWPTQAFEASLFAFLGAARAFNKKVHLPKLTGAKSRQHLGCLY